MIYGEKDEVGNDIILDYNLMLLYSLNYFKARTEEEIEKNNEDIEFSFYNGRYILSLIRHCKTKQGINYFSKLVLLKCAKNKEIFEIFVKTLIDILDKINDTDVAFFDESDSESDSEIYKNVGGYNHLYNLKTLKKNVSYIFRKIEMNSKNDQYKIDTCLEKLFDFFSKNKKYYSRAITAINIILKIFESADIENKKYTKELQEILNWLNIYKIPPKYYEINGINMYQDMLSISHEKKLDTVQKALFEENEIEKTDKKIKRINNILSNKKITFDITNPDLDLSDFKFNFGDVIIYENKEYVVSNCLNDMIKIKLIDQNYNTWNKYYNKTNKKMMSTHEKEKKSFWIETDNYKLRIKKLAK